MSPEQIMAAAFEDELEKIAKSQYIKMMAQPGAPRAQTAYVRERVAAYRAGKSGYRRGRDEGRPAARQAQSRIDDAVAARSKRYAAEQAPTRRRVLASRNRPHTGGRSGSNWGYTRPDMHEAIKRSKKY